MRRSLAGVLFALTVCGAAWGGSQPPSATAVHGVEVYDLVRVVGHVRLTWSAVRLGDDFAQVNGTAKVDFAMRGLPRGAPEAVLHSFGGAGGFRVNANSSSSANWLEWAGECDGAPPCVPKFDSAQEKDISAVSLGFRIVGLGRLRVIWGLPGPKMTCACPEPTFVFGDVSRMYRIDPFLHSAQRLTLGISGRQSVRGTSSDTGTFDWAATVILQRRR